MSAPVPGGQAGDQPKTEGTPKMRKIVANLFISLDGVTDEPGQWHFPYWNDEMAQDVDAAMSGADTMLLGRVTYDGFAAAWPDSADEGAEFMNNITKFVVSTTLDKAEWNNTTVIGRDEVAGLKEQPGGTIMISGSVGLVRSLLLEGQLDELHLLVHPIVLGKGARLFDDIGAQLPLTLTESKAFSTGVLALTYTR
jgi:dihydrofolate reductase